MTGRVPNYFFTHPVISPNSSIDIEVLSTQEATVEDISYLKKYQINAGRSLVVSDDDGGVAVQLGFLLLLFLLKKEEKSLEFQVFE